ncbi:hypothetical protein SDC9_166847 [bioreactor metagenome]|uniref:Uncharacterized protein n=1 Tax=bioreactor metagenome TaxID=1076179 RepID=A0A645FY53_9ZZZZ
MSSVFNPAVLKPDVSAQNDAVGGQQHQVYVVCDRRIVLKIAFKGGMEYGGLSLAEKRSGKLHIGEASDIFLENLPALLAVFTLDDQVAAKPEEALIGVIHQIAHGGRLVLQIAAQQKLLIVGLLQLVALLLEHADLGLIASGQLH